MKNSNKLIFLFLPILAILLVPQVLLSQSTLDTSFNAFPSRDLSNLSENFIVNTTLQPDGKILVSGRLGVMNGQPINRVARINADGTLDNTFNCIECNSVASPSIRLQDDGKIVVGGSRSPASDFNNTSKLFRVNSDGSLDNSYSSPFTNEDGNSGTNYRVAFFGKQSDGKLFVGRYSSFFNGTSSLTIHRLNTDGSVDSGFQSFTTSIFSGSLPQRSVSGLKQLPDGKLYVYGATNFGTFARLNADGTEDETYTKPTFSFGTLTLPAVYSTIIQSDGKVIVTGRFNSVNGFAKKNFARLNPDGSLDQTFADLDESYSTPLTSYPDGSLLINKKVGTSNNYLPQKLTADGVPTGKFSFPKDLVTVRSFWVNPTNNKIRIFGFLNNSEGVPVYQIARLNADGSLDPTFENDLGKGAFIGGINVQSDQKILMIGSFDRVNGIPLKNIARLNTDGTIDETFDVSNELRQLPLKAAIAPNGQIYLYGGFNSSRSLVRLNLDGSLDNTFNVTFDNTINTIKVQSDGKVLIGGFFDNVNGNPASKAARLNTDGTTDTSFMPDINSGSRINEILIQSDGKIVLAGPSNFEQESSEYLGRYNADGSFDASFTPDLSNTVFDVAQLPNGQYIVSTDTLQRLNNDGSIDESYNSPDFTFAFGSICSFDCLLKIKLLPDQSVIAYGNFLNVNGFSTQVGLTRVLSDGTVSETTYPNGTNRSVRDVEFQNNGKMIVGGDFEVIEKFSRPGIARLELPDLTQVVDYDFDGDGKADIAVFRPSENKWYVLRSSDFGVSQEIFAINGDSPVAADFDGDGKTDYSVFRNSQGDWWSLSTASGSQVFAHLGQNGDIPRPSDFDGDGRADYVVFRPSNNTWYRVSSATGQTSDIEFGLAGDKPIIGDFDGDGKSDVAIYRPSTGDWWWQNSTDNGQRAAHWGISTDIPTPGDYDGDGQTDLAVYRPETGTWYIYNSTTQDATIIGFGLSEDKPVPADYDGDGRTDIAVYRPSTGVWYLLRSNDGFAALQFGVSTDVPIPNALIP